MKNILISIALVALASTAVFAYFKVAPEQQKESDISAVISKLQEFKQSTPVPVLIPSYIPKERNYQLSIPPYNDKQFPAFVLISQDQSAQIEVRQYPISSQDLATRNTWLNGYPRLFAPRIWSTPIRLGDQTGYLDRESGGQVRLVFMRDNIVVEAKAIARNPLDRDALVSDVMALLGSMK